MIWIIIAGVAILLISYSMFQSLHYWRNKGVQQDDPSTTLFQMIKGLVYRPSVAESVVDIYKKFPETRYFGIYQFFMPALVVRDPGLIKQITVKDFDHFVDHNSPLDPDSDPLWTKNLISLKGHAWKEMRSTLSGSFTSSKMKHMFGLMKDASENFVKYFLKKDEVTVEVEMKDIFTRFTNDVIATTAFGVKVDSLQEQDNEFYLMGKEATDLTGFWLSIKFLVLMMFPKLFRLLKLKLFSQKVSHFFRNLIIETIRTREEHGIYRPDMIHLLMEARKGQTKPDEPDVIDSGFAVAQESPADGKTVRTPKNFSDDDIAAEALIFFFAGFDTVSNLMSFMAYELGVNQDVQTRLRKEINKTYAECNGNVTYDALLKMKYLDMVIAETLRKWPPAVATDRVCTKPYTIDPASSDEEPVPIKQGELLFLPIYGIQMDPQYYPEPDKFNPERFSGENKDNIDSYTYIPFGVGPRNCIGSRFALLETKAVFFYLLYNFEIVPIERTKIPLKLSKKAFNMSPKDKFWFGLKRV